MRAPVVFVVVAVFASCEAQQLELVPEEPPVDGVDAGSSGGARASGSGGGGGSGASGGRVASGGSAGKTSSGGTATGAGGGPGPGGFVGAGSGGMPVVTCKDDQGCRSVGGECVNSQCVRCGGPAGCKEREVCSAFTGRCEPSCDGDDECTQRFAPACSPDFHVCVECTKAEHCNTGSWKGRSCVMPVGVCVECLEHVDCGEGNRCFRGDCKCVDDSGCAPGRCDPDTNECVDGP